MITMQITVDVKDDRQVLVTLPPEVPTGQTQLIISVAPLPDEKKKPRTSLAAWAEANGEHWGDKLNSEDVEVVVRPNESDLLTPENRGWPPGYFDLAGSITDETFKRHPQGELPKPVDLE